MKNPRVLMAVAAAIPAAVGVGALTGAGSGDVATAGPVPLEAPSAAVVENFAVFASAISSDTSAQRRTQEQMPSFSMPTRAAAPGVRAAFSDSAPPVAARATALPDGRPLWVAATGDQLCAFFVPRGGTTSASGGCGGVSQATSEGFTTSSVYSDTDLDFSGMVPNGVSKVTLRLFGGKTVEARVQNNAYLIHLDALPKDVTFTKPSGETVTQPQFASSTLG